MNFLPRHPDEDPFEIYLRGVNDTMHRSICKAFESPDMYQDEKLRQVSIRWNWFEHEIAQAKWNMYDEEGNRIMLKQDKYDFCGRHRYDPLTHMHYYEITATPKQDE